MEAHSKEEEEEEEVYFFHHKISSSPLKAYVQRERAYVCSGKGRGERRGLDRSSTLITGEPVYNGGVHGSPSLSLPLFLFLFSLPYSCCVTFMLLVFFSVSCIT